MISPSSNMQEDAATGNTTGISIDWVAGVVDVVLFYKVVN
jgi:hypothetical protein